MTSESLPAIEGGQGEPSDRPSVTVLIPAHNEADVIERTVRTCAEQTYPPDEVIVIDDGSTDDTAELAAMAGARVLSAPGGSKARALNIGLDAVTTDLVVGVDGDTILAPDAVQELVATVEDGYDGTCGAVLPREDQRRTLTVRARWYEYTLCRRWFRPAQRRLGRIHVLSGAAFCYRAAAMRAVGGIPRVPIGEDANLTWTLQGAGYRLGYSPNALAYTTEPETVRVYVRQLRRWAASCCQVIASHPGQLAHPGRFLVVATSLWDTIGVSLAFALTLWLLVGQRLAIAGLMPAWVILLQGIAFAIVARDLGFRRALSCLPAIMAMSWICRWVYLWTYFREWVLGRHWTSWTGRQGNATVVTPMSAVRRRVFAGGAAVGLAGMCVALTGSMILAAMSVVPAVMVVYLPVVGREAYTGTHRRTSRAPAAVRLPPAATHGALEILLSMSTPLEDSRAA